MRERWRRGFGSASMDRCSALQRKVFQLRETFADAHKYKVIGVAETFSFPTQAFLRSYVTPRVSVLTPW